MRYSRQFSMLGVIIMLMVRGSGTTPIPITTPFAIYTPHKQIVIEYRSNAVLYQIDTTQYWNALANLAQIHTNLTEKVHDLNIAESDWPQLQSVMASLGPLMTV